MAAAGNDSTKKSRATSCTCCRQVKLKCDLKERYPNPCSRCTAGHHECRTDASFKRVPARSRIRDLESQLDRLKKDRSMIQVLGRQSVDSTSEPERRASGSNLYDDVLVSLPTISRMPYESPTYSDLSYHDTKWLNTTEAVTNKSFVLNDVELQYSQALELFRHFEEHYQPHFCILEPVESLQRLYDDSEFLFWCIIVVAARNHLHYDAHCAPARQALQRYCVEASFHTLQSLSALQGLLLLCAFETDVVDPSDNPSFTQMGLIINAAKQLGLGKVKDEVFFDTLKARESLERHSRHIRHLTWLKCFELDVQMSCWHGHLPSLAYPHNIRTVESFCILFSQDFTYGATVSVNIELAQSLLALEDGLNADHQSPSFFVRMFIDRLDAVKARWSSVWSLDTEIELISAKLYLYGACLANTDSPHHTNKGFRPQVLQASYAAATQLSHLLANLSADNVADSHTSVFRPNSHPFPGRPRNVGRNAYYAAVVLLKYLDEAQDASEDDREIARNAFGNIYQIFARSEHTHVAKVLEVAGRVIGPGTGCLKPHVTTRMGASLRYSTIWLASRVEAEEANHGRNFDRAALILDGPMLVPRLDARSSANSQQGTPNIQPTQEYNSQLLPFTSTSLESMAFSEPSWDPAIVAMPSTNFPYEVWDNPEFQTWQGSIPVPACSMADFEVMLPAMV